MSELSFSPQGGIIRSGSGQRGEIYTMGDGGRTIFRRIEDADALLASRDPEVARKARRQLIASGEFYNSPGIWEQVASLLMRHKRTVVTADYTAFIAACRRGAERLTALAVRNRSSAPLEAQRFEETAQAVSRVADSFFARRREFPAIAAEEKKTEERKLARENRSREEAVEALKSARGGRDGAAIRFRDGLRHEIISKSSSPDGGGDCWADTALLLAAEPEDLRPGVLRRLLKEIPGEVLRELSEGTLRVFRKICPKEFVAAMERSGGKKSSPATLPKFIREKAARRGKSRAGKMPPATAEKRDEPASRRHVAVKRGKGGKRRHR